MQSPHSLLECGLVQFYTGGTLMFRKVSTDMNFVDREKEIVKFWKENDIFNKSLKLREGCPTYTFYDGPPTANGKPHTSACI